MSIKPLLSVFTLAILASTSVQAEEKKDEVQINVAIGVMSESSPFVGIDNETQPVLAPDIEYGSFYWRSNELGFQLFEQNEFSLTTVLRPFEGFDFETADLPDGFAGLDDRDGKMEYGFTAKYRVGSIQAEFTPLFNGEGASAEFEVSKAWLGENYMVMLQGFARYDNADYQDYYFGVSDLEAKDPLNTAIDSAYQAESGISFGVKLIASYDINENWYALGMLQYQKLDSSIEDSPLVDETAISQIAIGIGYKF